jgi:hypothetical protein
MQGGLIKTNHPDGTVTVESFRSRQKRITKAVTRYARRNGMYVSTVRASTVYFRKALAEAGIV